MAVGMFRCQTKEPATSRQRVSYSAIVAFSALATSTPGETKSSSFSWSTAPWPGVLRWLAV
eukprot:7164857-Prorocentrum_lima.AAC.1